MRVRLRFATIEELPPELQSSLHDYPRLKAIGYDGRFAPIGTEFTVLGIQVADGNVTYRIGNPPREECSIQCLAILFEIVDGSPSKYWQAVIGPSGQFVLWPPSWFAEYYHDRLSDGDPVIYADFLEVRDRLQTEYPVGEASAVL